MWKWKQGSEQVCAVFENVILRMWKRKWNIEMCDITYENQNKYESLYMKYAKIYKYKLQYSSVRANN